MTFLNHHPILALMLFFTFVYGPIMGIVAGRAIKQGKERKCDEQ